MEIFTKLFGNAAKVKIMRLFLLNPDDAFDTEEIVDRSKVRRVDARREVLSLSKAGMVKRRSFFVEFEHADGTVRKKRVSGWILNPMFPYLRELSDLLIHIPAVSHQDIERRIKKAGRITFIAAAGLFIQSADSRLDLLIVGDNIRFSALEHALRTIEAEVGTEVRYSVFATDEFRYRLGMYDKLIRDVLDYPHEVIVDKIGLP